LKKGADAKDVGVGSAHSGMAAAGSRQWNIEGTKGTNMHGELEQTRT